MSTPLIVSVSGIRGLVGETLTVEVATAFAQALGTYLKGGKVALSRDGRPSGSALGHAVTAGLLATGCDVIDLGVQPTPTFGFAVRRLQAAGGIQISASHNPAPWNGLKLFGPDGAVLAPEAGKQLQTVYEQGRYERARWDELGQVQLETQAGAWHCARVLELVDAEKIRARRFRVLLDANGGAGGPLGKQLLEQLGCAVVAVGCNADGVFKHEPEPTEKNLTTVCPEVAARQCDLGCVLDPDADRLALIDDNGKYIGEELTLALAVQHRLGQANGPVVINMSTSRLVEDIAGGHKCECHRSAVGEANVTALMRAKDALIGGEGNGGVIDPRVGFVRDPFIGIGLILELLATSKQKLSATVAALPAYTIVKEKYQVEPARLPELYARLEKQWPEAKANRVDGLRLDWPERWLHVRPSNTEPIVRVIAEAPTAGDAEQLCQAAGKLLDG